MNTSCDVMTVQVFGSATALQLKAQGMTDTSSNDWQDIAVFNLGDLTLKDGSDGMSEIGIYSVPVDGLRLVRLNLVSVTGTVSATASFADTSAQ